MPVLRSKKTGKVVQQSQRTVAPPSAKTTPTAMPEEVEGRRPTLLQLPPSTSSLFSGDGRKDASPTASTLPAALSALLQLSQFATTNTPNSCVQIDLKTWPKGNATSVDRSRSFDCPKCDFPTQPLVKCNSWCCYDEGNDFVFDMNAQPAAPASQVTGSCQDQEAVDPWSAVVDPNASEEQNVEFKKQREAFYRLHCTCDAKALDAEHNVRFEALERSVGDRLRKTGEHVLEEVLEWTRNDEKRSINTLVDGGRTQLEQHRQEGASLMSYANRLYFEHHLLLAARQLLFCNKLHAMAISVNAETEVGSDGTYWKGDLTTPDAINKHTKALMTTLEETATVSLAACERSLKSYFNHERQTALMKLMQRGGGGNGGVDASDCVLKDGDSPQLFYIHLMQAEVWFCLFSLLRNFAGEATPEPRAVTSMAQARMSLCKAMHAAIGTAKRLSGSKTTLFCCQEDIVAQYQLEEDGPDSHRHKHSLSHLGPLFLAQLDDGGGDDDNELVCLLKVNIEAQRAFWGQTDWRDQLLPLLFYCGL